MKQTKHIIYIEHTSNSSSVISGHQLFLLSEVGVQIDHAVNVSSHEHNLIRVGHADMLQGSNG